jgi:methanogenic corrinoid protein MtbC1
LATPIRDASSDSVCAEVWLTAYPDSEKLLDSLYYGVIDGEQTMIQEVIPQLLEGDIAAEVILFEALIPAMREVGRQFEIGSCFVPQMLVAAHAMQARLDLLKPWLAKTEVKPVAKAAIGTVQSDIHDIGKT